MTESGSALSPEGNTLVSVDSEELDTKPKCGTVDKATIDNGSGPPDLRNAVFESGDKGNDCAVNIEENGEQKDIEETDTAKENDIRHSKEDNTIDDAKPAQNENTVEEPKEDDTIKDSGPVQKESTLEESKEDDTTEDARPVQKERPIEESKENDITEDARPLQMESSAEESKEDDTIEDARPVQNEDTVEELEGDDTVEDSGSVQKESTSQESKEDDTAKDARPVQKDSSVEESKEDDITEDARPMQKESIIEESKEDDTIKDARPLRKEITTEESKDDNRIEGVDTMAKQNDIKNTKDKNEIDDTIATIEDTEMVEEEGDKAGKGVTTTTAKSNDVEESKEGIRTEDPSTAKSEDGKKTDAEGHKIKAVEDGKMIVVEGDKAITVEDVEMVDAEDEKNEGVEKEEEGVKQEPKNHMEGEENGNTEQKDNRDNEAVGYKRKRSQVQIKKREGGVSVTKAKELLNSPISSSIERPVRERKAVERLVEVIENEASREFQVEKGRGTPLKDIPSVAHKLARKKPDDIKLIHHTLFGRRGKAVNFKHHILQFSGFVWHESDEKQRDKMKEKLDKYVKDTLLDLCDLFDLPASKANSRKEELVEKLLDFLVAPHPNNEQSTKSRKRKRLAKGSSSKRIEGAHSKRSRKKENTDDASLSEGDKSSSEMDDGDEVNESDPLKGKSVELSESEDDDETNDMSKENEHEKEDLEKGNKEKKRVSKQKDSIGMETVRTNSKAELVAATAKDSTKQSSSLHTKTKDVADDVRTKVFSRKKKMTDSPKKKSTIRSAKKEKDTGKRVSKDNKAKSKAQQPSKEELRKKICEILKEVDFNTATFTDILKLLATHYRADLNPRKASIKLIIQEELTKLAEAEDEEDEE
ncbi:trichohyalin-like [Zingiber officinale]|uniref:trichohyalin-like n=1 Tax=Zingiber officinale TaxID=94328 RepID=UPI001C4D620F|nr:trichohyalin-like [Zingiber officinale]